MEYRLSTLKSVNELFILKKLSILYSSQSIRLSCTMYFLKVILLLFYRNIPFSLFSNWCLIRVTQRNGFLQFSSMTCIFHFLYKIAMIVNRMNSRTSTVVFSYFIWVFKKMRKAIDFERRCE